MCIRDRGQGGEFEFRVDGRWPGHLDQVAEQAEAGEIGAGAVSYTHLRAHETVLDLVCRLLLEKKKALETEARSR